MYEKEKSNKDIPRKNHDVVNKPIKSNKVKECFDVEKPLPDIHNEDKSE